LLGKKKYKEVAWGLFVGVASTVLSLAYLGPSLMEANRHIADGLDFFRREYAEQVSWIGYDHSLFALYKFVTLVIADNGGQPFASDLKLYMPITAIFGLVIYMARIRVLPILNQVIALTAFSVLLPPVSYDYTLVHLLLPCGLLMVYAAETWRRKEAVSGFLFGCFAVIFTWGTFLNFEGVRVAGQIRSVAMVFLLAGVLLFPFPQAKVDQVSTARS
jgi:hypothetical protein